ncbi:Predicted arabinose efflux permease, MFS family [Alicyclobacillus macrosporangiidus]|uniref:Predicted arabinose efflux permease, MFS family n=2 Tax=Alicyclobacillus macrosporangiidus TaxID=392015 RepID=A0A1I7LB33_9BACL|nr:Predicted arabinose efflux permease, MFS family [Alicyclobacillus macrosporangiidus]
MNGMELLRRNHNYRNLWLAQVGSQFGDWFNQVALAQITLELTGSASAMGLVLLCRSLPGVILGPLVGPYVDRFPTKPLLFFTDLVRAVIALSYCVAVMDHATWVLYAGSLLLGVSGVLFSPSRNATIPLVVSKEDLTTANALESAAAGVLQIVGAICGGFVSVTFSPLACFLINSASYVWSALHILRSRWHESTRPSREPYFRLLTDGFHEAMRNRVARAIILIGISWGLAGGGYYILIPVLGEQTFHMGGFGIGVLYTMDGAGVLLGSLFVHYFVRGNHRNAVVWYGVAYTTQALFFGILTQATNVVLGCLSLLLMRMSSGVIIPLDAYLLQTGTDPTKRGRVFSLHVSTYGGVMQLSYVATGFALQHFGIHLMGMVIAAMSLICGVCWLLQFGRSSLAFPGTRAVQ